MSNNLIIYMYHYVRDFKNTKYPNIRGLDVELFRKHVDYLMNSYNLISYKDLMNFINENIQLPQNPVLLTFDDGYKDHYDYVYPILKEKKLSGIFYIPTQIFEKKILDVNKIHFILESSEIKVIKESLNKLIIKYKESYNLNEVEFYVKKSLQSSRRYDDNSTAYVKNLLQKELPRKARNYFCNILFNQYVDADHEKFVEELYMSKKNIIEMQNNGQFFGFHTHNHEWLDKLSLKELITELNKPFDILDDIDLVLNSKSMCYPYGAYNQRTIDELEKLNFDFAVTTRAELCNLDKSNIYELPRFDCNDLTTEINNKSNSINKL